MRDYTVSMLLKLTASAAVATGLAGAIGFLPVQRKTSSTPVYSYQVVKVYPHDRAAFTQGLQFVDGVLYEGTGQEGQSVIRKVKYETGEVLQQQKLDDKYFGEGIVVFGGELFQLTWKTETGFVYDKTSFKPLRSFKYPGEGWGLTTDGTRLIMSDGSDQLRFWDPKTLKEIGPRLTVRDAGRSVPELNELEWMKGEILANVWQSHRIARIAPKTGEVTGWIDLTGLLDPRDAAGVDVLNGIAYDEKGDRLFVTGKLWPKLFEIKLVPPAGPAAR